MINPKRIYTVEDLKACIKEIRDIKEILTDKEAQYILLYNAALDYGCPIQANGKPWGKPKKKKKDSVYSVQCTTLSEVLSKSSRRKRLPV